MSGHGEAFAKWFARYNAERLKRQIPQGRKIPDFPSAPPGPDDVHQVIHDGINPLGERRAAELCNVHRTTIVRWLDGSVQIPPSAFALLEFHANGVPPGCGEAWRGFSWSGNTLTTPDGRTTLTAFEIAGATFQKTYVSTLENRVKELEALLVDMTRRIDWGSANDAFTGVDPRSKAFASP